MMFNMSGHVCGTIRYETDSGGPVYSDLCIDFDEPLGGMFGSVQYS